jgi:hypothetical protein
MFTQHIPFHSHIYAYFHNTLNYLHHPKGDEMVTACDMYGSEEKYTQVLMTKPEETDQMEDIR